MSRSVLRTYITNFSKYPELTKFFYTRSNQNKKTTNINRSKHVNKNETSSQVEPTTTTGLPFQKANPAPYKYSPNDQRRSKSHILGKDKTSAIDELNKINISMNENEEL